MNVGQLARALSRRWWIVIPILVLTAWAAIFVSQTVEPRHQATASLLLVAPDLVDGADPSERIALPPTLSPPILAEIAEADVTRSALGPDLESADYTVDVTGDGTVLKVVATDASEERAVATAAAVLSEIQRIVSDLRPEVEEAGGDVTFEVLSLPSLARPRTIIDSNGESRVVFSAAGSALLLFGSQDPLKETPYEASNGTLRVLQEVASTESVRESVVAGIGDPLVSGTGDADFEVSMLERDSAPIMNLTATGPSENATMEVLHAAIAYLDSQLVDRQAASGADESTWIRFERLAVPDVPQDITPGLMGPLTAIVGLGLLAAASLAVMVDNIVLVRNTEGHHLKGEDAPETGEPRSSRRLGHVS